MIPKLTLNTKPIKVKRALISVYDKKKLNYLCTNLRNYNYNFISSGSTGENIRKMGQLVGHPGRAKRMIDDFNVRLEELRSGITERPRAAIYSANGYTTGTDTMSGQILKTAGFRNITEEVGMSFGGTLPLETLVMLKPDLVITGKAYPGHSRSEEILKHPALRPFRAITQTDAKWICGTPAVLDAVAELQRAHPEKGLK